MKPLSPVISQYCAAHIWCCPTSVIIGIPLVIRFTSLMTPRGVSQPPSSVIVVSVLFFLSSAFAYHSSSEDGVSGSVSRRASRDARRSPITYAASVTFLSISAGSMSNWTILALPTSSPRDPVARSVNLAPMAIMTSALLTASVAKECPCIPVSPRFAGNAVGIAERPIRLHPAGACIFSESRMTSSPAPALTVPPPQYIMGRFADFMSFAASSIP